MPRSGSINPATFDIAIPEDMIYCGKSNPTLRSDGSVVGILVLPIVSVPGCPDRSKYQLLWPWLVLGFISTVTTARRPMVAG